MTSSRPASPFDIRTFTAEVAATVAEEHCGDPVGELLVWLQMALRREASVGQLYGIADLERRLEDVRGPRAIVSLVRTAISNIWAQEKAHAAFLDAALLGVARPPQLWQRVGARFDGLIGSMEGRVLSGMTSPSPIDRTKAELLLAIGSRLQDVPPFVAALSALSFRDFCLLNAELEVTAVHGYDRMLVLLDGISGPSSLRDDTTLAVDVARMAVDERFHNETFAAIAEWFEPSARRGQSWLRAGLALETCSASLARIRNRAYEARSATR